MSLLLHIAPSDLGLPDKFSEYRSGQAEAIDWSLSSEKAILAASAPTGIGKSLWGVTTAVASASKTVYLTATKALQNQVVSDFASCGMTDIRGRANYPCSRYTDRFKRAVTCDEGADHNCSLATTTDCPYMKAAQKAEAAQLVCTNYSYWLHARANNPLALSTEDNPVELLICDEAHNAPSELASYLEIALTDEEISSHACPTRNGLMNESAGRAWKTWAAQQAKDISAQQRDLAKQYGSVAKAKQIEGELYVGLEKLKTKLQRVGSMDDNWVWERTDTGVLFSPIWTGRYADLLFSGVPRALLYSATLRPYTLSQLGLAKQDYEYREFTNGWPANFGPVYYLPTVRLNYKSTEDDYRKMVAQVDAILAARSDRKGIIQTVSYARMKQVLELSRFTKQMHWNANSGASTETARRYRSARPPATLVSPSYGTGWDFAYDQCEYQILIKVPFPYSESRVMQERCKDETYRIASAMTEVQQMIGRGRRAPDDRCETFILDAAWPLVCAKGKQYAPRGFNPHKIITLPKAPQKIKKFALGVAIG